MADAFTQYIDFNETSELPAIKFFSIKQHGIYIKLNNKSDLIDEINKLNFNSWT